MDTRSWQTDGGARVVVLAGHMTGESAAQAREFLQDQADATRLVMDLSAVEGDMSLLMTGIVGALKRQRTHRGRLDLVGQLPPDVESTGLKELMGYYETLELALVDDGPDDGLGGVREPRRPLAPNDRAGAEW
jgi:anti-anti-sigma regulatory factor